MATLVFGQILAEAELPAGVVNVIAGGPEVGRQRRPNGPTSTGSASPARSASARRSCARPPRASPACTSSSAASRPNIILPDFELDQGSGRARCTCATCATPARAAPRRRGSSCRGAKYDEFLELTREVYAEVGVGDPWDPDNIVGPLIRPEHREFVEGFVERALAEGGEIVARRRPAGHRARLVRQPDPDRRRSRPDARAGPERGLRPARDRPHLRRCRGGDPDRQRDQLRPRRLRQLRPTSSRQKQVAAAAAGRQRLHQRRRRACAPTLRSAASRRSGVGREGGIYGLREYLEAQHVQWAL